MNIDKISRELQKEISKAHFGHTVENPYVEKLIKAALQAYGDECAKNMREASAYIAEDYNGMVHLEYFKTGELFNAHPRVRKFYATKIKSLPLPSEVSDD